MFQFLSGHEHGAHHDAKTKTPVSIVSEIPSPSSESDDPITNFPPAKTESLTVLSPFKGVKDFYQHTNTASHNHVSEQRVVIQRKVAYELGASISTRVFDTSHDGLLEWVRSERLLRLPHKGGSWDRCLVVCHQFADEIETLHHSVESFTTESDAASRLVYGQCLLLLELGHENALALEKAFNWFYQLGLELRPLLRHAHLFRKSADIQQHISRAYGDLMHIVTSVAIHFYQLVHGLKHANDTVSVDIYATFGDQIDLFRSRLERTVYEMWEVSLKSTRGPQDCDVKALTRWLAPQDSVLRFLASNHVSLAVKPEQFTCTWFAPHLSSFVRSHNNILMVEGKTGAGKSVLANWTLDRLQRSIGRTQLSTLNFAFNPSIMAQATTSAMLKTLLYQLLQTAIGNVGVYRAVKEVYDSFKARPMTDADEDKLWTALSKSLDSINREHDELLVIVLDGVDDMPGQKSAAQKACKKLHDIAHRLGAVRIVQFSQKLDLSPPHSTRLDLSADHTMDDTRTIIQQAISTHAHFNDRGVAEQEEIIDDLSVAAAGSMLWASLACDVLRLKTTHSSFTEAVEALKSSKTVSDVVMKLLGTMHLNAECKLILSWLFTAERPLTLAEIQILLRIHPDQGVVSEASVKLDGLLATLTPFIVVGEGLVALRHNSVEQAILSIKSTSNLSLHLTERHRDFVIRLFVYAKTCFKNERKPTLDLLDRAVGDEKLQSQRLLEYTVRYWSTHVRKSTTLYKATGPLELPAEIRGSFPKSVTFALMERLYWNAQFSTQESIDMHLLAYRVRHACFGLSNSCVLQSAIICASLLEACDRRTEAVEYIATAMRISKSMYQELTLTCCTALLRISETLVEKKRTEIMSYREETYLLIISIYKHRFGGSSKEVLEIYHKLAALYVFILEQTKATAIYTIIREITIVLHGVGSEQDNEISRHLDVVLHAHEHGKEIDTYKDVLFGAVKVEGSITITIEYIRIMIEHARKCIIRGELSLAEEIYIGIWQRITALHISTDEWREMKLEIMVIYARFLHEHGRHDECRSMLLIIWKEYESRDISFGESIVVYLHEIAVMMKTLAMFTLALSVFNKCHFWYSSRHQIDILVKINVLISETMREIVKTTTTTTSTSSETVMRSVFETIITSTEVTTTHFEVCTALTLLYIKQEKWSEAIYCLEMTLKKSWTAFFSLSVDIVLSSKFIQQSIDLVIQLTECYIKMSRWETVEYYYLRLFRAIKASCEVDSKFFIHYSKIILEFYTSHGYFEKAIAFHQELLVCYRAFYGVTHAITIGCLYVLGELCCRYQRTHGYWIEYYKEILIVLNKGSSICHEKALEALIIVARYYYEDYRYSESLEYFRCILETFVKYGKTYAWFLRIDEVQEIFDCYFRSLEESKTKISLQIEILKQYRSACVHFYSESHSLTIHATIKLAEVCSKSVLYEHEAISFYELVVKFSEDKTVIKKTETIIKTIYVKQITSTTTTTTATWTKEMWERATTLIYQHYIEITKSFSHTEEATLIALQELISIYVKRSMIEVAIKELRFFIGKCFTKKVTGLEFAAKYLVATIYMCKYESHAYAIVEELKLQLIYKSTKNIHTCGFNVTGFGRECFAFVAAFEYYLKASFTITIADYMAALVAESLYYERFCIHIKEKASFEVVFWSASLLRQTLFVAKRLDSFVSVHKQTVEYFFIKESEVVKGCSRSGVEAFVTLLLEYFGQEERSKKTFVAASGYAALIRIRLLLSQKKHQEALDLTKCTYQFLMAHKGLDDKDEINLGFRLCLAMANQGKDRTEDAVVSKSMLELSRRILAEVFAIVQRENISLVRCQLAELDHLIRLVAEQKDFDRLKWLLTNLWSSREGQTQWSKATTLLLGKRLVQAHFSLDARTTAIRMAEDLIYNVKRVFGVHHAQTLSFSRLLSSLYITTALHYINAKNEATAKVYFRKAIAVHEDALKSLVDADSSEGSDEDDLDSDAGSGSHHKNSTALTGAERSAAIQTIREHLRLLKLAFQRFGGWVKPAAEYERLTSKAWKEFGTELGMKEDQVLSAKWSAHGFGNGKAESNEDNWKVPESWTIIST